MPGVSRLLASLLFPYFTPSPSCNTPTAAPKPLSITLTGDESSASAS
ncbi:MAG: hypothetical protein SFV17_08390 [Candidatus Obscuribacter sp.]|nr:hypothetical protein [Candidatus Obscuribacter sp.]